MKIQIISWDQETVDHIANHSVLPEEVEQVLFNAYDVPVILRGKENKYFTYTRHLRVSIYISNYGQLSHHRCTLCT